MAAKGIWVAIFCTELQKDKRGKGEEGICGWHYKAFIHTCGPYVSSNVVSSISTMGIRWVLVHIEKNSTVQGLN